MNGSPDLEDNEAFTISREAVTFNEPDALGFHLFVDQNLNVTFAKAGDYEVKCMAAVGEPYSFSNAASRVFKVVDPNDPGGNGKEGVRGSGIVLVMFVVICALLY